MAGFPECEGRTHQNKKTGGLGLTIAPRGYGSVRLAEIQGVTNELAAVCRQKSSKRIHLSSRRFIIAVVDWDNLLAQKTPELRGTCACDGRRCMVVGNVYACHRILFASFS